ncbi:hypothetical protein SD37_10805 [Amycolatopsis orientalis]|uniref:Uncharacterized protein n=1 Tax=Amycolatopsis orientalis TaxID=31958 RepID=A0A193BV35_AMYOR|nr:hypothetical protein SD37_10805 [Amycolatopsis orientalis]
MSAVMAILEWPRSFLDLFEVGSGGEHEPFSIDASPAAARRFAWCSFCLMSTSVVAASRAITRPLASLLGSPISARQPIWTRAAEIAAAP